MISETKFEMQYQQQIRRLCEDEGVSYSSALDNLLGEYRILGGDDTDFNKLLIAWGLKEESQ